VVLEFLGFVGFREFRVEGFEVFRVVGLKPLFRDGGPLTSQALTCLHLLCRV
jgi:hypothetical protein